MTSRNMELWFITGSQHLYGPETREQVAADAKQIDADTDLRSLKNERRWNEAAYGAQRPHA